MASPRMQRWSLTLNAYSYQMLHKPDTCIKHADALSRLPLPDTIKVTPLPGEMVMLLNYLESIPVQADDICKWTDEDPVLSKVKEWVLTGWPDTNTDDRVVGS